MERERQEWECLIMIKHSSIKNILIVIFLFIYFSLKHFSLFIIYLIIFFFLIQLNIGFNFYLYSSSIL